MGISASELCQHVIRPTLQQLDALNPASETLLREAARHLLPGGELRIVANSFLRYPPLIEEHLGTCQTLAEAEGFRIYRARKG